MRVSAFGGWQRAVNGVMEDEWMGEDEEVPVMVDEDLG